MVEEEIPAGKPDGAQATRRHGQFWRELPVLLAIAIVVALVVRTFVLQSFWIPSGSMENTLQVNDRVLVNKLAYNFQDPDRGEIVVFKAPEAWRASPADEDFIKRVIAVSGDTVSYASPDGKIAVNGQPIDESSYLYTNAVTGRQDLPSKDNYEFTVTVPQGRVWVMGDHRSSSGDSRENYIRSGGDVRRATIDADNVVGRAEALMWPAERWRWLSVPEPFAAIPSSTESAPPIG